MSEFPPGEEPTQSMTEKMLAMLLAKTVALQRQSRIQQALLEEALRRAGMTDEEMRGVIAMFDPQETTRSFEQEWRQLFGSDREPPAPGQQED